MSTYILEIDTSINNNTTNSVTVQLIDNTIVDVINNTTVLISDLPEGYPLDWTIGNLPFSRISGLDVVGGNYIDVIDNSGIYTISAVGLQPSGNYSVVGHTHTTSNISDFNSSVSGLLPVKNISAGSGINVTNTSGNFVIAVTGQFGLTSEQVDDRISDLLIGIDNIILTYDDNLNKLTIGTSGLQPSGNYSIVGHNHNSSDILDFNSAVSGLFPNTYDAAVSWTPNHTLVDGTRYLAGDLVYQNGRLYIANYDNESLPVSNTTYWTDVGHGYRLNIDGRDIPNIPYPVISVNGYSGIIELSTIDLNDFNSSVSGLLTPYALLDSPAFSGIPTVPTASSGTNSTQIASTAFVRNEISNLVDSAPSTLDTLNELAQALGDDANFAASVASGLANKASLIHSHTVSEITDFNSGVSGLLPVTNILGGTNISVIPDGSIYTINISGQLGLTTEEVDDRISNLLIPGTGITLSYNDNSNTLSIASTGLAFTSGANFDNLSVSGISVSTSGHVHNYTDITNWASGIENEVSTLLVAGNYINIDYDNIADTLTISTSGLQPSGNYSIVGHIHTSSNITDFNSSVSGLLPTISNSGDNRLLTSTGSSIGINAESNLTFDGSLLNVIGSGVFSSGLYVNNIPVSVSGHTHTSNDISDFNSAVSGLLPVKHIVSGTDISVTSVSGIYTINSTVNTVAESASLVTTIFNKTGSPIPKMSAVYINGGQGDTPTVSLGLATGDATSAGTYGLTYETIPNMSSGKVIVFGALTGLNTDQFNPTSPHGDVNGTVLYLSTTVPGALTTIKPHAPYHMVVIGTIVRTHQNEGVIEVRIQNGFELEELHNVAISGVTNGQFLQYDSDSSLWIPSSSGNFSTLLVNGNGVSISGHTHSSSDITDFNSSVSGLIPVTSVNGQIGDISLDISKQIPYWDAESTYYDRIMVYHSDKLYIANTSNAGEEPDLYASLKTWTQIGGVSDIVGGSNISVIPSGSIYTISVSGSLGLTTEEVDDRVSNLLVAGSGIGLNYDDNANSLTIAVSGLSSTAKIGDGISGVITYNLSDPLNIVGSGSTTIDYNNISKTVTIGSPSLIREYELITSTKSTFSVTGGYALNNLDVYHNGIKLLASGDYTATNGSTFDLIQPAVSGDVVEWLGYSVVPRHQLILGEVRSDTVGNINYLGRAVAGSPEASGVWTIKRYTVADNGIDITTAIANNAVWDNRLTETYL